MLAAAVWAAGALFSCHLLSLHERRTVVTFFFCHVCGVKDAYINLLLPDGAWLRLFFFFTAAHQDVQLLRTSS